MKLIIKNLSMTYVKHQIQEDIITPVFGVEFEPGYYLNSIGIAAHSSSFTGSGKVRLSNPINIEGYSRLRIENLVSRNNQYSAAFSFFKNNNDFTSALNVEYTENQAQMSGAHPAEELFTAEFEITPNMKYLLVTNGTYSSSGNVQTTLPTFTLIKD